MMVWFDDMAGSTPTRLGYTLKVCEAFGCRKECGFTGTEKLSVCAGRNVEVVVDMMSHARLHANNVIISVEIEKVSLELPERVCAPCVCAAIDAFCVQLTRLADYCIFSKEFVLSREEGAQNPEKFMTCQYEEGLVDTYAASIICPWGLWLRSSALVDLSLYRRQGCVCYECPGSMPGARSSLEARCRGRQSRCRRYLYLGKYFRIVEAPNRIGQRHGIRLRGGRPEMRSERS